MSTHLTETRFDGLGLHEALLAGLRDAGFEFCTPIQAETLPLALAGNDIAGQAQTGTGKTFAFLLALMHQLLTQIAATISRVRWCWRRPANWQFRFIKMHC